MEQLRHILYIIPVGENYERAIAKERNPEIVYLLTQRDDPENLQKTDWLRTNVERVKNYFSYATVHVLGLEDYFNIFELMAHFRYIAETHHDCFIRINVGSGSKLSAISAFTVSGWYDYVTCFYPRSDYTGKLSDGSHNYSDSIQLLRSFSTKRLERDLEPVIDFLNDGVKSKKEILDYLVDIGSISKYQEDGVTDRSAQSLYNLLKRNFIAPLTDEELIEENKHGEIELTERGSDFYIIFCKQTFFHEYI